MALLIIACLSTHSARDAEAVWSALALTSTHAVDDVLRAFASGYPVDVGTAPELGSTSARHNAGMSLGHETQRWDNVTIDHHMSSGDGGDEVDDAPHRWGFLTDGHGDHDDAPQTQHSALLTSERHNIDEMLGSAQHDIDSGPIIVSISPTAQPQVTETVSLADVVADVSVSQTSALPPNVLSTDMQSEQAVALTLNHESAWDTLGSTHSSVEDEPISGGITVAGDLQETVAIEDAIAMAGRRDSAGASTESQARSGSRHSQGYSRHRTDDANGSHGADVSLSTARSKGQTDRINPATAPLRLAHALSEHRDVLEDALTLAGHGG